MTRPDPRIEGYDRGEPLGAVHEQLALAIDVPQKQASLAACKAKAIRSVAAQHYEDFQAEMLRLGWRYVCDGEFSLDAITGRPRQWVRL